MDVVALTATVYTCAMLPVYKVIWDYLSLLSVPTISFQKQSYLELITQASPSLLHLVKVFLGQTVFFVKVVRWIGLLVFLLEKSISPVLL